MSKKAYFISAGCLFLGLVLGIVGTMVYLGKVAAQGIFLTRAAEISASGDAAGDAYEHDSTQVAIGALLQHLAVLQTDENLGTNPLMDSRSSAMDMLLTHGRLAELYSESGQTNQSAQQMGEALKYAEASGCLWATNQETLLRFVSKGRATKMQP